MAAWVQALGLLAVAAGTQGLSTNPADYSNHYALRYIPPYSFNLHWECDSLSGGNNLTIMMEGVGEKWFGLGIQSPGAPGYRMQYADMMIMRRVNGQYTVQDAHGNTRATPSIDTDVGGTNDLRDVTATVINASNPVTQTVRVAFTRNITSTDIHDENPGLGQIFLLYAQGASVAGQGFSTTPLAKHPPLGNPRYNGLSQPLTLCPAPPTTAAPTQPSSTTRTTTTQTLTTVTQTTATTQTSTSSTTQMPLPSLPPLAPPNFTADGRVDLGDSLVRHGREQGLMASYYSYAGMNHVVTIERDSYSAARQNWYHGQTADAAGVVPQINFPPHVRHRMGSPYDQLYASEFYGEIEITVAGVYNFSILCSDDCQFRLKHTTASMGSSRNRLIYIGGPVAPREQTANPLTLAVGFYEILVSHGAALNDTGTDADLRNNLGLACVLYWSTPQYSKREVPAWALSHRAPKTAKVDNDYLYNIEGSQIINPEGGRPTSSSSVGRDTTWYGTSARPSWHRVDLGYECSVASVTVTSYQWYQGVDVRVSNSLAPFDYSTSQLCNNTGWFGNVVSGWRPNATVSCRNMVGRYIYLLGNATSQRIYDIQITATPVRASPQPAQFAWPQPSTTPFWRRESEVVPNSYWHSRLDNLHRIYPSVVNEVTDKYDSASFWSVNGIAALSETFYYDYDGWLLNQFATGQLVLDLGFEHTVSAIRVLNSHGRSSMNRGVKRLRVDSGSPPALVNVAQAAVLNASRPAAPGQSLSAITDADPTTCYHTARNTSVSSELTWVSFDLGSDVDVDSITINTGRTDAIYLTAYLTSDVAALVGNSNWLDFHNGTLNNTCNGMRHSLMRFAYRNASSRTYENNRYYQPTDEVYRMPCRGTGRYVVLRLRENGNLNLCDVQINARASSTWTTATTVDLNSTFIYGYQKDYENRNSNDKAGMGPWQVVRFPPVRTRYLRLTAESMYKAYAGLGRVELWSPDPVPEYQIANHAGVNSTVLPGLRMDLYPDVYSSLVGLSGADEWAAFDEDISTHDVRSSAVVPNVNFFADAHGTNPQVPGTGGVWPEHPTGNWSSPAYGLNITQQGRGLVGACSANCDNAGVVVAATFDIPFPTIPNVTVTPHRFFGDVEMHNNSALAAFAAGFDITVLNVSLTGFSVRVTRRDFAPWGGPNTGLNGSFAYEYSAVSFFPTPAHGHGESRSYPPGVNPFMRSAFHARAAGELTSNRTGAHTLYLVGGNRARLYINGTAVVSLLRDGTAYEGYWPSGQVTVHLQAGVPLPIEVQFSTAGRVGDARASLSWSYSEGNVSYGRSVIPPSAFTHSPRSFCLTYDRHTDVAHVEECLVGSPYQSWRFDGKFVRAAGDAYSNRTTTAQTKCLTSMNTDGSSIYTSRYNLNFMTMRTCTTGGYTSGRTTFGARRTGSCWDSVPTAAQLWSFEGDGTLLSLSTRNPFPNGTSRCPQAAICGVRSLTTHEGGDQLACELHNQTYPHMCLQAGLRADTDEASFTTPCALNSTLQQWTTTAVDGNTTLRTLAFGGNYRRYPHSWGDRSTWRLSGMRWATYARRSELCQVGDANNTCMHACDGTCNEVEYSGVPYSRTSTDCAPFTDGWDCNPQFGVASCARMCSDRADCAAFATAKLENRAYEAICYFWHTAANEEQLSFWSEMTYYAKVPGANATSPSSEIYQPDPACPTFTSPNACPPRCQWVPAGALSGGSGLPIEDPPCVDVNTGSLSCASFRAQDDTQVNFYGSTRNLLCDSASVGSVCALTCNRTGYCPNAAGVCADPASLTDIYTAPSPCVDPAVCDPLAPAPPPPVRSAASLAAWDIATLQSAVVENNASECYYAIFSGQRCASPGAVYRITPAWYTAHPGGMYNSTSLRCGAVVEDWLSLNPSHGIYGLTLGEVDAPIVGPSGVAAEYVAPFDCATTSGPFATPQPSFASLQEEAFALALATLNARTAAGDDRATAAAAAFAAFGDAGGLGSSAHFLASLDARAPPAPTAAPTAANEVEQGSDSASGSGAGGGAAIGIGVAVAVVLLVLLAALFVARARRQNTKGKTDTITPAFGASKLDNRMVSVENPVYEHPDVVRVNSQMRQKSDEDNCEGFEGFTVVQEPGGFSRRASATSKIDDALSTVDARIAAARETPTERRDSLSIPKAQLY